MKKSINIVGAFDRYNYGDVLFPIILEEFIKKYKTDIFRNYKIEFYGLIDSNLEYIGGKKTKGMYRLYREKIQPGSAVIVAGGDVLAARISDLYFDLSDSTVSMYKRKIIRKLLGRNIYEKIIKNKLGVKFKFPWILDSSDFFNHDINILYNSVGGSTLDTLKYEELLGIKSKLKKCSYLSVRDNKTRENILNLDKDIKVKLAPDSAFIMSYLFSLDILKDKVSNKIYKFIEENNSYICIQTNNWSVNKGNDKILIKELELILEKEDVDIVLLPIGLASNHDDKIALKAIYESINNKRVHYFEDVNIFDIMYCIANSKFFAGTSLHGNITAMSYGIRHIGLNKEVRKLDMFLKTWDIEEQNHCIDFNELYETYINMKSIDNSKLEDNRNRLVNLSLENFNDMFNILK